MNGAESLVRTLVGAGVDTCFANPGTSEMHFVSALDRVDGMRSILVLHETVATGAADGYWRMADRPAANLLHLGPGLANGLSNIHNARKAASGMLNIIGEHASWHLKYDAPLASDIEGIARPLSDWVKTSLGSQAIGADAAQAVIEARQSRIASLILPGDTAWEEGGAVADALAMPTVAGFDEKSIEAAVRALRSGESTMLIIGGRAIRGKALEIAGRIAGKTGAVLATQFFSSRIERGAGRVPTFRIPYFVDSALGALKDFKHIVTIETKEPVSFFAYPNKPSQIKAEGTQVHQVCNPGGDGLAALEALAEAVGAKASDAPHQERTETALPSGALNQQTIAHILSALIPENAIVVDESVTTGRESFGLTAGAAPHDWLQNMGGSIGFGLPVATGAAIGAPGRRVISLSGDGCAMYTLQSLWTQAREGLDVTTLVFSNRAYQILRVEFAGVGAGAPGEKASAMMTLDNPPLDFLALARGLGVPGTRVSDCGELIAALKRVLRQPGPHLIDVTL
ncbi:Acetolactate synthase [Rhizobium sp. CF080]|uniref:acetolactate synthase large subunit n=1 Tax=Rhizobium sp. (strain CF080) TaxID=1144310 RepID=UPI000271D598|nr:acetolactate synthase large subunit [Rhizobium sp. CF080]EUB95451.1 Acetolactate synthase [Rhizobium sp. CF080]